MTESLHKNKHILKDYREDSNSNNNQTEKTEVSPATVSTKTHIQRIYSSFKTGFKKAIDKNNNY